MRPHLAACSGVLALTVVIACSSESRSSFGEAPKQADSPPEAPPPSLGEGNGGAALVDVKLGGKVLAPNGSLPLSNALVYVTNEPPPAIPSGAYCDECVKLPEGSFAVSAADGTFAIATELRTGKAFVVVQKGQFRRVREIDITKAGDVDLEASETTLPALSNPSKGDDVPRMVVLKDDADFDQIDASLKKLGITQFDVKQDRSLLLNETELLKYHVVFIPCGNSDDAISTSAQAKKNLQKFVATGGKLYVTDWSYEFVRQPFPGYLAWDGETTELGSAASGDEWDAPATAADPGLADWLAATGDATFKVEGNWTTINDVVAQKGKDPKGLAADIVPKVWVTAVKDNKPYPTTVSFQNQCGRVLFSTYHTENSFGGGALTAQEKALLYVLLEVGVCVGEGPGGVK